MRLIAVVTFLIFFSFQVRAEEIALTCNHYKSTYHCSYEGLQTTRCSSITERKTDNDEVGIIVNLGNNRLIYDSIAGVPFGVSGSNIHFDLATSLGFEVKNVLNRISGQLTQSWRVDISERKNQHMYPGRDSRGFATIHDFHYTCKKSEKLF